MRFIVTEKELVNATGYSRVQVQNLRLGGPKRGGKGERYAPKLWEGRDWIRHGGSLREGGGMAGGTIMYAEHCVPLLKRWRSDWASKMGLDQEEEREIENLNEQEQDL